MGDVLDALTPGHLWKNTTVALWSDHGFHLGDRDIWRKFTLWEEAASVPLIIADPDVGRPGARVSTPASLLDVWPTVGQPGRLAEAKACGWARPDSAVG